MNGPSAAPEGRFLFKGEFHSNVKICPSRRKNGKSTGAVISGAEFVLVDFAAQRIAVNAENLCGARLVAVGAVEDALDEALLELFHGLIEQDSPVYHLGHKPLKLIFHDGTLRVIRFQPESNY
jgi:hypothetical protein